MSTRILLVDESPVRKPFLSDLLRDSGKVTEISATTDAIRAVGEGLGLDVAVLHYRTKSGMLVRLIRACQPEARIVAFGSPRRLPPNGVDQYLHKPLLGVEVLEVVEQLKGKRRKGQAHNGHGRNGHAHNGHHARRNGHGRA